MLNNNYTLITGASEGFGKALALECASRKMNLVLIALPGPEIFYLADFIKRNYKVDVVSIETDLSVEKNCYMVFDQVTAYRLNVNMLINNAGLGSTMLFSEGSIDFYQKQVQLNVAATTLLTRLFLDMLKSTGPSYILNVGSLCSFFFLAKKQVYGGTKSFIYFFSKSLKRELQEYNVHVSVICPGGMNTNVSVSLLNRSTGWLSRQAIMNPEQVAPIAINGLLKQKEVIIPGRINKIFVLLNRILPKVLKKEITNHQMKKLLSVTATDPGKQVMLFSEKNSSLIA
jgi:uncharacterized protein